MHTSAKRHTLQLILPYLDLDIKYYDLGLEFRDAVRPCRLTRVTPHGSTRVRELTSSPASPDQRPDHDRLCRGHPKVQRRNQMRYHHPGRGPGEGIQLEADVEKS